MFGSCMHGMDNKNICIFVLANADLCFVPSSGMFFLALFHGFIQVVLLFFSRTCYPSSARQETLTRTIAEEDLVLGI